MNYVVSKGKANITMRVIQFRKGGKADTLGLATLRNRVKSHPDVGEKWYPEMLKEIREEQKEERRRKAGFQNS